LNFCAEIVASLIMWVVYCTNEQGGNESILQNSNFLSFVKVSEIFLIKFRYLSNILVLIAIHLKQILSFHHFKLPRNSKKIINGLTATTTNPWKHFPHNFIWSEEKWLWAIIMNIFGIIAFNFLLFCFHSHHIISNQIRIYYSIKHELSEWLWKFSYYSRFIFTAFAGMWKGNLILSTIWIAIENERTWNDPYLRKCAIRCPYTQYNLPFLWQKKSYASSKIIYPVWMLWICFLVFLWKLTLSLSRLSIILIYFAYPDISVCLLVLIFNQRRIRRHFHPSTYSGFHMCNTFEQVEHEICFEMSFLQEGWKSRKIILQMTIIWFHHCYSCTFIWIDI
jgi:hypothetical protein